MSNIIPLEGSSPFDAIRKYRNDGSEYWIARELMPLLGYRTWQKFGDALDRALIACENALNKVSEHFLPMSVNTKQVGRPQENFELSRFGSYLVAMNGDPRKPEIAAAQTYFALKTREAETGKDTLKIVKEQNKNLELQLQISQANLETLKIEKGIIALAPIKAYKVIDLTGIDNIESVQAYIRDRIKLCPTCKIYVGNKDGDPTKLFYPNYLLYCHQHNCNSVTVQRFSKVFMQLVYVSHQTKLGKGRDSCGNHIKGAKFLLYQE